MSALIPLEDERLLAAHVSSKRVAQVHLWCEVCEAFIGASMHERSLVAKRLVAEYAGRIEGGMSLKTLYRKAAIYRAEGWRGLLTARERALGDGEPRHNIASNMAFLTYWQGLVGENQRVSSAAFRTLIGNLRSGIEIPGYGTWREIWRMEHPGRAVPEVCPYREGVLLPQGWSQSNLQRHKPSKWGLRAMRVGALAASNLLPMVQRTRAGLKRGQIIEVDDMWHDVKVRYGKNQPAERCIELAMLDVATGYRTYLLKPIRRREDGTRETMMARMMPYLLGYWIVVQGYRAEGAMICGEHATAALSKPLAYAIEQVTGGKVKFASGGLLSKPLLEGLHEGRPRGNFRFKARLESGHRAIHDALAHVPGQVGYTHDNAPEELYGRDKVEGQLLRACQKLASKDPNLYDRLKWPYLRYEDYAAIVAEVVANLNARTEHNLEGWEAQGFIEGSFRHAVNEPWMDLSELELLPPAIQEAWMGELERRPELFRVRRLSPTEAWARREGDVIRAGRWAMPILLGDKLMMKATCSDRMELKVRDAEIEFEATVVGHVVNEEGREMLLTRGATYGVWVNPLEASVAYVAEIARDGGWKYLGVAKVMTPGHQDDLESTQRALGLRQKVLAMERKAVAPLVADRAAQAQAERNANAELLQELAEVVTPKPERKPRVTSVHLAATMEDLI